MCRSLLTTLMIFLHETSEEMDCMEWSIPMEFNCRLITIPHKYTQTLGVFIGLLSLFFFNPKPKNKPNSKVDSSNWMELMVWVCHPHPWKYLSPSFLSSQLLTFYPLSPMNVAKPPQSSLSNDLWFARLPVDLVWNLVISPSKHPYFCNLHLPLILLPCLRPIQYRW